VGAIHLLKAHMFDKEEYCLKALQAFKSAKPFENLSGIVECYNWFFENDKLGEQERWKMLIKGIGQTLNVCIAMMNRHGERNVERVRKYVEFYGFHQSGQDQVEIHPKERPLCLEIARALATKEQRKKKLLEVSKDYAHEKVTAALLERVSQWVPALNKVLTVNRETLSQCEAFSMGQSCEGDCSRLHKQQTEADFKAVIGADLMLVELEGTVQSAIASFRKQSKGRLTDLLNRIVDEGDHDLSNKYEAVLKLWNDMLQPSGHPVFVADTSAQLLDHVARHDKVQAHIRRYLQERWSKMVKGDRKLKCEAVRETDIFMILHLGYYMFRLSLGKEKMERSPKDEMAKLEYELDKETQRKSGDLRSNVRFYSLLVYGRKVQCIARDFMNAYELVHSEPFEAVYKFSKFLHYYSGTKNLTQDEFSLFLMWIEFYTVLAFLVITKLKSAHYPDVFFVCPNSYLSLLNYIGATFPSKGINIETIVMTWQPPRRKQATATSDAQERLGVIANAIAGRRNLRLMQMLAERSQSEPHLYAAMERQILLALTLICNVSEIVPVNEETSLMGMLCQLQLPDEAPQRLKDCLYDLSQTNGIGDISAVLVNLLEQRNKGEQLMVCTWNRNLFSGKKPLKAHVYTANQQVLFPKHFLNGDETYYAMTSQYENAVSENLQEEEEYQEEEQTEEEQMALEREKQRQANQERRAAAVTTIVRWYRTFLEARKQQKSESKSEIEAQLHAINVTSDYCGICGKKLEHESSQVVGATSVQKPSLMRQFSNVVQGIVNFGTSTDPNPEQIQTEISEKQEALKQIRTGHMNTHEHQTKAMELNRYKKNYEKEIGPKLREVSSFMRDPVYGLTKKDYVERNYKQHATDIDRIMTYCQRIEKEIQVNIMIHILL